MAASVSVPDSSLASVAEQQLVDIVRAGRVFVLTGAGVSTASGIPDYRDERGQWKRPQPIEYRAFVDVERTRRRYWARSALGWQRLSRARPNPAHDAIAALESSGVIDCVVTQNVDGLHQAAGSRSVIDLHGRIDRVRCMACEAILPRARVQQELVAKNPGWVERPAKTAPDGDADPGDADYDDFRVVPCRRCGGILKPDVVFFGESVPRPRVDAAFAALDAARSVLVVGSSLKVFSGYRFVRAAQARGLPIAIVNRGLTRADTIASLKLEADAATILSRLSVLVGAAAAT